MDSYNDISAWLRRHKSREIEDLFLEVSLAEDNQTKTVQFAFSKWVLEKGIHPTSATQSDFKDFLITFIGGEISLN